MADDATKIIPKITVHQGTRVIHGISGSPYFQCPATELALRKFLIEQAVNIAEYVMVTMLVPILAVGSPPLPAQFLALFATNNRFDSEYVSKYHSILIQAMLRHDMSPVIGGGSDGDSRYMQLQFSGVKFASITDVFQHAMLMLHPRVLFFDFQDPYESN